MICTHRFTISENGVKIIVKNCQKERKLDEWELLSASTAKLTYNRPPRIPERGCPSQNETFRPAAK